MTHNQKIAGSSPAGGTDRASQCQWRSTREGDYRRFLSLPKYSESRIRFIEKPLYNPSWVKRGRIYNMETSIVCRSVKLNNILTKWHVVNDDNNYLSWQWLVAVTMWIILSGYVLENREVNKWLVLFINSVLIISGIESFTVLRNEQDVSVL